jgi:hypothetical protein
MRAPCCVLLVGASVLPHATASFEHSTHSTCSRVPPAGLCRKLWRSWAVVCCSFRNTSSSSCTSVPKAPSAAPPGAAAGAAATGLQQRRRRRTSQAHAMASTCRQAPGYSLLMAATRADPVMLGMPPQAA